jgi:ferritin-like metal-binding protein YciE
MNTAQQKLVQYLMEARASEHALVRVLQSQIAMTPSGSYRTALEEHLDETRNHAARVSARLKTLKAGLSPMTAIVGFWEDMLGQTLALSKTPLDMLRGSGGEEKVFKNAKDTCATEALEAATYLALEHVARQVGDDETADVARQIREEEERMLARVMRELPRLADAVVGAEVNGERSYDVTKTGAAETVRAAAQAVGADTPADDDGPPISGYDGLTAEEITGRLPGLSQADLATVDAYERKGQNRSTVIDRVESLRGDEPWPGYDEQNVADVQAGLADADEARLKAVREYERSHKDRAGVLRATERHASAR